MSSTPSASNTNKTFSVTPSDNLSSETSYKTRITTGVKDLAGNALGSTYTTSNGFTSADVTAPILSQVTAVSTPTNDNTSSYTFSSTEAGTITYGGSCSSDNTSATIDNNTVTFNALADGTYDNCTITVTDSVSNASSTLNVNTFVVDTTAPTVSSVYPTDNQSGISITTENIVVTFSETMDNTSVTTNTDNTTCYGTFALSSDNFSSCVQMSSSPSSSNSDKTFTVDPSENLSYSTTYKIRVTTGVKDIVGNTLSSQYETSSGFTTYSDCSNDCFVAVGYNGNVMRSTDNGTTWDNLTSPTKSSLFGVTFGNNTFVGVGDYGNIVRSTDNGTTWDNATSSTAYRLQGVTFGNNTFVGVGIYGNIVRSTDNGSTFENPTSLPVGQYTGNSPLKYEGVTFGNDTFVAVGRNGKIVRSTDNGSSWDNATTDNSTAKDLNGVTFGNNTFVAVGDYGNVVRSTDNGTTWDNATSENTQNFEEITFGNNTFVAVSRKGRIFWSTDNGSTFTYANSTQLSLGYTIYLFGVTFGNNTFVAVGYEIVVRSTDNGSTFENVTPPIADCCFGVTFLE
jgi:photosystem II stability/assembly factor-like uncharacterized protein